MDEKCNKVSIDEIWNELSKVTNTVIRNVERMTGLLDQLIEHQLQQECHQIEIPIRKVDHLKEREKYAKDYKQFLVNELSAKLKTGFNLKGSRIICNKCLMYCRSRKRFIIHLLKKHCEFKFYLCQKCFDKFENYTKFKQHLQNFHDEIMIFQGNEQILQLIDFGIREFGQK